MTDMAEWWAAEHGHDLYPEQPSSTPTEVREWESVSYAIRHVVESRCTFKQQQVIRLVYQGLTVAQIATATGTSRQSVEKHLNLSRKKLGPTMVASFALCRGEDDSELNGHAPILERIGDRSPGADTERLRALPVLIHDTRDFPQTRLRNGSTREVACSPFVLRGLAALDDDLYIDEVENRISREQDRRARRGWASPQDRLRMMRDWYANPVVVPRRWSDGTEAVHHAGLPAPDSPAAVPGVRAELPAAA